VHESNGVRFYNDSIATIPEAAVVACSAFEPGTVIQIVGGSDKKLDMEPMCRALSRRAKAVLCIGQIGPALAKLSTGGSAVVKEAGTLAVAMEQAKALATPGDVVLLSPGSASYGQFVNFEERGEAFSKLAKEN